MSSQKFYGKYRGVVLNNIDPQRIGRILASVPAVSLLLPTSWCMPCYPVAGKLMGISYVPQIGSGVWIEFEGGDPDHPIWSGCFWGTDAEMPGDAKATSATNNPVSPSIVLHSTLQNRIVISDLPGPTGGIILKSLTGASIIVNDTGIYIDNGKGASIVMIGPNINVNKGALSIT
ncbi:MAG TPA: phage baseplate assembly protein V [Thermoanaerobaculia bacterium]|nr:phage baseplate assembly protein V [Thermoanaerobaculia bacterium]